MPNTWAEHDLALLAAAEELLITSPRPDGTWPAPVPVWVVVAESEVYVRTLRRRATGWFGRAAAAGVARVAAPGLEAEVQVDDVGIDAHRAAVDAAYRAEYGDGPMVGDGAADATLRLRPV